MYRFIRYAQPLVASAAAYGSRYAGLEQELNALFGSNSDGATTNGGRSVPVSVHDDKENLYVTAELPGVQRADVSVELADEVLSLRATRKVPGAEGEQTVSYARDINLVEPVQADKISAELKDGVLRVTLPKIEAVKPRKIDIS